MLTVCSQVIQKKNKKVELVEEVREVNEKIFKMASAETNFHGTGGMLTKLQAAEIAAGSGCNTIICKGTIKNPIKNYFNKCYGTKFFLIINTEQVLKSGLLGQLMS